MVNRIRPIGVWQARMHRWTGEVKPHLSKELQQLFPIKDQCFQSSKVLKMAFVAAYPIPARETCKNFDKTPVSFAKLLQDYQKVIHILCGDINA